MEEKYRIGEEREELIGPAEHHNRELVTKQESYERILLEEKTAAVTLNNEERADRERIWFLKAQAAQKRKLTRGLKERRSPKKTLGKTKSNKE